MRLVFFLLIVFSLSSCYDKEKNTSPETSNKKIQINNLGKLKENPSAKFQTDQKRTIENTSSGISTNPSIFVRDGKVEIHLKEGVLNTETNQSIQLVKDNQINGSLILKDTLTNAKVDGTTIITNANIIFTPNEILNPRIVYNLALTSNERNLEYKENIFISGSNYCNPTNYFSVVSKKQIPTASGETIDLTIRDNVYTDSSFGEVAIIGWDHLNSKSFYLKINNRTIGAKYKIVAAYGVYNLPGHDCELYYQRDIKSPYPIWEDNNYGSKTIKITQEDTAIHHPITKEFYHFTKTFVLVKVFNSFNVDITGIDTGILSMQQTDSLYGLPTSFNSEEESALLAYLNKGNNNSYSMALGGLIVGIFAFFLSRKILRKDENN